MRIEKTALDGLHEISLEPIGDTRGFLMEVYRKDVFRKAGLEMPEFVQVNHSRSQRGVIRGLHFQWEAPLGKFIRVINGEAFIAAVDIRKKSATLGKWLGFEVSAENKKALWVPAGFASGFCATGDIAEIEYFYTAHYNPHGESNIRWNDPELGVNWPVASPALSERDRAAQSFHEWLARPEADLL